MVEVLENLQTGGLKTLVVMSEKDENLVRSANNLPHVKTLRASYLNVIDLLVYDVVVMPQGAVTQIESWLGTGSSSVTEEESAS